MRYQYKSMMPFHHKQLVKNKMKSIRYKREKEHRRACHAAQLSIRDAQADRCLLSQSPRPETAVILHFQERMRRAENDLLAHGADFAPQNRIICIGADVSGNSPGSPRCSDRNRRPLYPSRVDSAAPSENICRLLQSRDAQDAWSKARAPFARGWGEAIYEASFHRVAECDHLTGNAGRMGRQLGGGGQLLLTTPESRARRRSKILKS
jgi:hypothetical protein